MKDHCCELCNNALVSGEGTPVDKRLSSSSEGSSLPLQTTTSFIFPSHRLSPQVQIPPIGIGTYELRGETCVEAVRMALQLGFRLIDTAAAYRNEALVGEGIRASKVPRKELFVNVKIAMKSVRDEETIRAGILKSIDLLGIGYADAILVHWPGAGGLKPGDREGHSRGRRLCWKVMHELHTQGLTRCIGVSNYYPKHFAELLDMPWACPHFFNPIERDCNRPLGNKSERKNSEPIHEHEEDTFTDCKKVGVQAKLAETPSPEGFASLPVINQIELHPLCTQDDTVRYCRDHRIHLQQYSPLGKGDERLHQNVKLQQLQQLHFSEYSISDILLLWGLVNGFIPLVRSGKEEHLQSNWQIAVDYFASLHPLLAAQSITFHEESSMRTVQPSRPPLTSQQREVLIHLPEHLGIEEDVHLCWDSVTIA